MQEMQKENSKVTVWEDLEPKYQMFATMYAENGSFRVCANHFDLKIDTMRRWSRMPAVAALINHNLDKYRDCSLVNRQLIERSALDVLDIALGHEDTHGIDNEGGSYQGKVTNLPAANQALALLQRVDNETENRKIKAKTANKFGGNVIVNIERANFNSNQHVELLEGLIIDN